MIAILLNANIDMANKIVKHLVESGLGEIHKSNYVRLDPALPNYLKISLSEKDIFELPKIMGKLE